jgi:glutathione peroxidase
MMFVENQPPGRSAPQHASDRRRARPAIGLRAVAIVAFATGAAIPSLGAGPSIRPPPETFGSSFRLAAGPVAEAPPSGPGRTAPTTPAGDADCPLLLRHTFNSLQTGKPQSLCQYKGKVVLVVNTATYCGYTHQYEGLEALYRKYRDRGLVVLGFPSNDYGAQEPGTNKEIAEFCRTTYGIEFPMFEKATGVRVAANPLYAELTARTGQAPKWNFHKYLLDRSGKRVTSFGSDVEPGQRDFESAVERLLAERSPS